MFKLIKIKWKLIIFILFLDKKEFQQTYLYQREKGLIDYLTNYNTSVIILFGNCKLPKQSNLFLEFFY